VTSLERYLLRGRRAGCPRDQMDNLVMAGVYLQERQLAASAAARLCDSPGGPSAVGYGGSRGGGKSHWLLAQMGADDCQRVPGLKCLLLRKVGKANMENFEDLRRRLFTGLKHEFSAYRGVLSFANGSRIIAGISRRRRTLMPTWASNTTSSASKRRPRSAPASTRTSPPAAGPANRTGVRASTARRIPAASATRGIGPSSSRRIRSGARQTPGSSRRA